MSATLQLDMLGGIATMRAELVDELTHIGALHIPKRDRDWVFADASYCYRVPGVDGDPIVAVWWETGWICRTPQRACVFVNGVFWNGVLRYRDGFVIDTNHRNHNLTGKVLP